MKNYQHKTKIIKASVELRSLARIAMIIWALTLGWYLVITGASLSKGFNARMIYIGSAASIELVLAILISWQFFRFFDRLKNGALFDAKTVGHLAAAGRWWLVYWLLDVLIGLVGIVSFGARLERVGPLLASLLAGMMVVFVAWLLEEAQELQEEQALTV
jgi:hypothetical protein